MGKRYLTFYWRFKVVNGVALGDLVTEWSETYALYQTSVFMRRQM